ncbi:MAG: rod shape-determining protein MreC [Rhodothermales bacterium]|nr:rod shape-determining protein MreC [Rhodothermales bacterium]
MIRLWERFGDWFLLIALVLVSLMVLLTVNTPMVRGLRARSLEMSSRVEDRLAAAGRYLGALQENERLREENIRLSSELALRREAALENERLRGLLGIPDSLVGRRVAARVVSKDITRQRNSLVISVGSEHGIAENMAVVDPRGIVGVVDLVGPRHSVVRSFLDPGFMMPVKIEPHLSDGILERSQDRPDRLEVLHVPTTDPIATGQRVVSSGYSGIFRRGLAVGVIDSVSVSEDGLFWEIRVDPATPLSTLQHVFVLTDQPEYDRLVRNGSALPEAN